MVHSFQPGAVIVPWQFAGRIERTGLSLVALADWPRRSISCRFREVSGSDSGSRPLDSCRGNDRNMERRDESNKEPI